MGVLGLLRRKFQLTFLFVCGLRSRYVVIRTMIPSVVHVRHPRHSKSIQSFPTDDTWKWNSWKSILSNSLNDNGSKFSIAPRDETGRRHSFPFRLLLKSSDETTLCTAAAITWRRPIRDSDCATAVRRRCTRYTLVYNALIPLFHFIFALTIRLPWVYSLAIRCRPFSMI